jgi:hypothetical protein
MKHRIFSHADTARGKAEKAAGYPQMTQINADYEGGMVVHLPKKTIYCEIEQTIGSK